MHGSKPHVSVCIATYKRPEELRKLLLSLTGQETAEEFTFEICIADNDAGRSAEPVATELNGNPARIHYDVEPEQNISLARNKSLAQATGDYIATIDDDCYADRQWLLGLCRTAASHDADVVHGPVHPKFPSNTPAYIRECEVFNRPSPPSGSSAGYVFATGNSFFRRALVEGVAEPFHPRFGKTGGEDGHFFTHLQMRGCRMVWCREALVFGPVQPSRARLSWILKRKFRYGNTRFSHHYESSPNRQTIYRSLFQETVTTGNLKKFVQLGGGGLFYIGGGLLLPRYRQEGMKRLLSLLQSTAYCLGILAYRFNYRYEEYRPK